MVQRGEVMSMDVQKGEITSVSGSTARVKSSVGARVSRPLKIPKHINTSELSKGTKVAYVVFEDMSGAILAVI